MADGDDRQATFGSDGSLRPTRRRTRPATTTSARRRSRTRPTAGTAGTSSPASSRRRCAAPTRRSRGARGSWPARLRLEPLGPPEPLRRRRPPGWQRRGPLTIERYEELATERWEPAEWKGRLCAIHAALAAARARSTREASNADAYFSAVAEVRAEAHERDEEPAHDFPVGDLEPEGQFDAIFDGHTGEGARRDRGTHFFKTHGARVGPEGEDDQSARWERLALLLDDETDYSPADLDRARSNRWTPKTRGASRRRSPDGTTPTRRLVRTPTPRRLRATRTQPPTTTIPIGAVRSPTSLSSLGRSPRRHLTAYPILEPPAARPQRARRARRERPSIVGSPDARAAGWRAVVRRRCVDTRFR